MDRSKCTTFQSYNTHIPEGGLQASCKQASNRMIRNKVFGCHVHHRVCSGYFSRHKISLCFRNIHCMRNGDSDLEAFNRNPARGRVAILARRLAAFTNYVN